MSMIVLEFNELSPHLMAKFMAAGKVPNFKRLHDESRVAITEADDPVELEPWVQWIAVHSGIPYSEHGIKHLGDGHMLERKSIWDLVSDAGKSVWVCGSMNLKYERPINGWVLPDPWSAKVEPYPADVLEPYFRFVSANVQEHTRAEVALSRSEQVEFLRFMIRHGLSPATVAAIVRQLASERIGDKHWQRAAILDRLQFDLFRRHWKQARPDFSTFFLNSTAHYQHLYWRNMEPEHFKVKPGPGEQEVYEHAILYGYQEMDRIVGQVMRLAGDDVTLVLLTALSQQPSLTYEEAGGKVTYRPVDFQELLDAAEIDGPVEVTPVMSEEFHLGFESEEAASAAEVKLRGLRLGEQQVVGASREGNELKCGCQVWEQVQDDAVVALDGRGTVPFFDLFYKIDLMKSGEHHPDGLIWVRGPERRHEVEAEKVPLETVAPMLLEMLAVERPSYMAATRVPG